MINNKIRIAFVFLFITGIIKAQNTTNVPTSMYGLGELSMGDGGKYSGLGNAAIALNRKGFINTQNAACITSIDSTEFVFDFGISASYSKYSMLGETSSAGTGNPNRISLGVRMLPKWYTVIGVASYSSVGYMIKSVNEVEGTADSYISSLFEGDGGLYRFYFTNAYQLRKNISVGVNVGMISGKIEQTETDEGAVVKRESKKSALYTDFGLYYAFTKKCSFGLVYGMATNVSQKNTLTYDNSSVDTDLDTYYHNDNQYIPQRVGVGLTYDYKKITLTADYNWIQWSRNKSSITSVEYIDQHKLNIGMIYNVIPQRRSVELMCGVGISNSYIKFRQGKMNNLDLNAGIAIPFRESVLSIGISWKKQLNTKRNLMQEDKLSLNFNMTFGERMSKGKIN